MSTPHWPWELPPIILAAAIGPALLLLLATVAATRSSRDSIAYALAGFVGGALLAAPAAAVLSSWVLQSLAVDPATMGRVGAPLVEEGVKTVVVAATLVLPGGRPVTLGQLALRGWCVGLGFTAMENTHYLLLASLQGGPAGLVRGVFVRGVAWGLHHALFTAVASLAVWSWVGRPRSVLAAAAWLGLAVVLHGVWNALGGAWVTTMLCDAPETGSACRWPPDPVDLFLWTPLVSVVALAPGLFALRTAARRAPPQA